MECQLKMQYRPGPAFQAIEPTDGNIWKHPKLAQKVRSDRSVQFVGEAYLARLTSQATSGKTFDGRN